METSNFIHFSKKPNDYGNLQFLAKTSRPLKYMKI